MRKIFTFLLALVTSVGLSWATTTDLASITANYTAQDGEILTGTLGANVKISIADGATVTLLNANINGDKTWTTGNYAGLTCLGDATITIVGKNSVSGFSVDNGYPGIYVPSGKTLIINGTGSLTAQSSTEEAAGIGAGRNTHCGNIEIQSGKITAIAGGEEGAGIGGGFNANCGNITISGGVVTAVGGYRGAGIGGGRRSGSTNAGHCGNILISGGVVSATSGEDAAAIGGGRGNNSTYKSNCGTITITNTALKVYADQGGSSTNTIGAGKHGTCGTVTIGGNTGVINDDPYTYRTKEDGEIVVDYINAIGTVVYTQECKDKIDIARELYDALEDAQKDLVSNYQTLLDAEAAYAALIPQPVTTYTLQLVADPEKGSVAVTNLLGSDIIDNGNGNYTVPENAEVTILATPLEGYEFSGWKEGNVSCDFLDCGTALNTLDNPLTFTMTANVAYLAEFAATPEPEPGPKVQLAEFIVPSEWTIFNEDPFTVDLLTGFVEIPEEVALTLSAPATGKVAVGYAFTGEGEFKYVYFVDGELKGSYAQAFDCGDIAYMSDYYKFYYPVSYTPAPEPEPTAVENVQTNEVQASKLMENGVLYILHNGVKYNVMGAKLR